MTIATTLAKTETAVYVDKLVSVHDVSIQNNNFISELNVSGLLHVNGMRHSCFSDDCRQHVLTQGWMFSAHADKETDYFAPLPDMQQPGLGCGLKLKTIYFILC